MSLPDHESDETAGGSDPTPWPATDGSAAEAPPEAVEAPEAPPETSAGPRPPRPDGWTVIVPVPNDGVEPPGTFLDADAEAVWAAVSAGWHPAVLAVADDLPRLECLDGPTSPGPREVRVVPGGMTGHLPSGHLTQCYDAGAHVVEGETARQAIVDAIVQRVGPSTFPRGDEADALAADFQALGTAWWWLRDLAAAMGHVDGPDHDNLAREALDGASAWAAGDLNTARNRLRAAFEVLTQSRERFYPVDAYLVDLCLLDPASPGGCLKDLLDAGTPVSLLAPARAIEVQAALDPDSLQRLREAITDGRLDVIGGAYAEVDEPLLPVESILWQFRRGGEVYRAHLDERNVETLARRRFALYPQLPQVAKRFGFRFGYHMGFDAGRFPVRDEAKRLWESPDHSHLESLLRPPLAADSALAGLQLPWRLARSMKDDHVATLPLAHWPDPVAGWYRDLRRTISYSPVLARAVTVNDYFHQTDRPYETFHAGTDAYVTPYLAQAVARRDPTPSSGRATHARLRARLDALTTSGALARGLGHDPTPADLEPLPDPAAVETALETGRLDEASADLDRLGPYWTRALARGIAGARTDGRPGYLVLNPVGTARRAPVLLPGAAADLRPEGPLRAVQVIENEVWGVVDVPAFGFAWVPRENAATAPPPPASVVSARDRTLRNETIAVEIDRTTGGIRGVRLVDEDTARLGQQLVIEGLTSLDGQPVASRMVADGHQIVHAGPALAEAESWGALLGPDDRRYARFRQRVRLWVGRPLVEVDLTLTELDPAWLDRLASGDPWARYLGCRWAWPDPASMLRRTVLASPELTEADRPETPDALDVSTRRQRTALLFGGLAHHRRHGPRMLDTLLVAGAETGRSFQLGLTLDQEYLAPAALDLTAPAFVVPTETGPPAGGPTGWLLHLDSKGAAVSRVEFLESTEDGRGWGLALHVLETAGTSSRCRLRTFRNPSWARQTDFLGSVVVDLSTDGDSVLLDLTPHELARVEVTLG